MDMSVAPPSEGSQWRHSTQGVGWLENGGVTCTNAQQEYELRTRAAQLFVPVAEWASNNGINLETCKKALKFQSSIYGALGEMNLFRSLGLSVKSEIDDIDRVLATAFPRAGSVIDSLYCDDEVAPMESHYKTCAAQKSLMEIGRIHYALWKYCRESSQPPSQAQLPTVPPMGFHLWVLGTRDPRTQESLRSIHTEVESHRDPDWKRHRNPHLAKESQFTTRSEPPSSGALPSIPETIGTANSINLVNPVVPSNQELHPNFFHVDPNLNSDLGFVDDPDFLMQDGTAPQGSSSHTQDPYLYDPQGWPYQPPQ